MTVTAQAPAPPRDGTTPDGSGRSRTVPAAKPPAAQAAKPAPPAASSSRRGAVPLGPMRQVAAKSMTTLADQMKQSHPDMIAHQHVRDAAKMLKAGNEEAAQRHLRAAAFSLSPQSLMRHGLHTDDAHIAARNALDGVHRHMLLVRNVQDADASNRAAIAKLGGEDDTAPRPPADPNNGYGPGALAQKPTARQPPGDQALNAPAKADGGGSDLAAADPDGPQPKGSKQFTTRDGVRAVTELAYDWGTLAAMVGRYVEMASANGHHIAGTPYEWEHNYVPLTHSAAGSHFKGSVPKSWHAPSGGRKKSATPAAGEPPVAKAADKAAGEAGASSGADSGAALKKAKTDLYRAIQARQANPKSAKLQAGEQAARQRFAAAQEAHDRARGMPVLTKTGTGPDGTVTAVDQHGTEHKISLDEDGSMTVTRNGETATMPNAGEDPNRAARTMSMYMAQGRKDQTGAKAADRLTVIPNAIDRQAAAQGLTSGELRAADTEFARRAALLGKPGQQSKAHKAVAAEMQKRGLTGTAVKPKPSSSAPKGKPSAGNEKQLSLISERMTGADKTSGEMKAGDMQEGHQAIAQAPVGILGNEKRRIINGGYVKGSFSDPWWMAGPGGTFAVSQRWKSPAQTVSQKIGGEYKTVKIPARDERVLTPWPAGGTQEHAITWADLAAIELSAKTAALEVTPALYGKPGGPGLYGVAGNKHSDYFEQVVKGLMTKRGMDKATASKIAWGALRKWRAGGGHVSPEVKAAATGALAKEAAAGAKAKATSHATSWDQVERDIRLATVLEFFNPAEARVPTGSATAGQFTAGGAQPASQQQAKGKAAAKPDAHQLHVLHVAHVNKVSTAKAKLLVTAQDDRQQAAALEKQRDALEKALQSASGKTNSGQAGSTTSANATTSSTAPSTTPSTASTAAPASTATASSSKTPAASTATAAAAPKAGSAAAMKTQIAQLNTQIDNLLAAAKQAETQAAGMK